MRRTRHDAWRRRVALLAVATLLAPPVTPLVQAQTTSSAKAAAPAQTPAPKPGSTATPAPKTGTAPTTPVATAGSAPVAAAARPATPAPPVDGGWPRAHATPSGGRILVYQPQVAEWTNQKHMVAYAAVSWQAKGAAKPSLGTTVSIRFDGLMSRWTMPF